METHKKYMYIYIYILERDESSLAGSKGYIKTFNMFQF